MKKVIDIAPVWETKDSDSDSPIIREGVKALFDDGRVDIYWNDGNKDLDCIMANDEDKKLFRLKQKGLSEGDLVKIVRGRKSVGEQGTIKSFYRVNIKNAYKTIIYVVLDNGIKVMIKNVDPILPEGVDFNVNSIPHIFDGHFINGGRI